MPARLVFRCQFCDRRPDPLTQLSLEHQVQELLYGQYLDMAPERWLVFTGRGAYGPRRYACPDHRGELIAELREHYGTIGPQTWVMGPYPSSMRTADTAQAWPPSQFTMGLSTGYRRGRDGEPRV
jgi:hypothetical protein